MGVDDPHYTSKDIEYTATSLPQDDTDPTPPIQASSGGHGYTQRRLHDYQLTWIGLCSGIGTGLFIGTGSAYASAGPAGILLAYAIVGIVLWCMMQIPDRGLVPALGDALPRPGRRLLPRHLLRLLLRHRHSLRVLGRGVIVSYWTPLTPAVTITVGLALILALNLASVTFYGHSEVAAGAVKVLCFLGLIVVALVITWRRRPRGRRDRVPVLAGPRGLGRLRRHRGSQGTLPRFPVLLRQRLLLLHRHRDRRHRRRRVREPHRAIPRAAKTVTYRIAFFYILGALLISLIVSPQNPALVSGAGNANASPWVIAIKNAGIPSLPSIVNTCILISAWSAGNSYCWVGSRILVAMTTDRQLPQIFGRTTKHGVPYVAVITAWLFGPLAYLSLGSGGAAQAFQWLLNLSTVAGLIAWATLCLCYIRFHRALQVQGLDRSTLPWKGPMQPYAAWSGFVGSIIITLVAGFGVFVKGHWSAADFVASYVGIPIFIVPIVGYKVVKKTKFARAQNIDLWSGRFNGVERRVEGGEAGAEVVGER
ncbi:putative general amino acid permease [Teratosphaeria destructans]|uniref:General amino acid permease n=1 Tax=Teratosphaeria destructans TaxID=418781 RepID=A0A9W7T2U0_9PEZI|nr:putative general amino acid permease [Teratosphaeria destructans]